MNALYLAVLTIYLAAQMVRFGYEQLKKAGRIDPENPRLFVVILGVMLLMWASWFIMCPWDPSRITSPDIVRWIGLAGVIVGLGVAIGGLLQLGGVENIDHLATTGVYSRLRHPMYTGFILWIIGWAAYHGAVFSLVAGCVGIANILYWRWLEERALESRYGEVYRGYRKATWF